jgi:hypothetical protein
MTFVLQSPSEHGGRTGEGFDRLDRSQRGNDRDHRGSGSLPCISFGYYIALGQARRRGNLCQK